MPIYQGDSYTFTLSLTREDVSVVEITAVSYNVSLSPYAVYSFNLISGPYLHLGNGVLVTGCTSSGNNSSSNTSPTNPAGVFTIIGLGVEGDSGTFSVINTNAVTEVEPSTTGGIVYTTSQTVPAQGAVGLNPNITASPLIQIIQLSTLTPMLGVPASMVSLDGTIPNPNGSGQLWLYTWSIGQVVSGEYAAIVSYAADGNVVSGKLIEKIQVGDSFITGIVALDATVAKNATVALAATTATASQVASIDPAVAPNILAILAKTNNLPPDPAGMTLLGPTIQDVQDLHDAALGSQTIDKTQSPALYTLKRTDSSILAQFQLTDNTTETTRTSV